MESNQHEAVKDIKTFAGLLSLENNGRTTPALLYTANNVHEKKKNNTKKVDRSVCRSACKHVAPHLPDLGISSDATPCDKGRKKKNTHPPEFNFTYPILTFHD
ncbi:hypothetical protein EVAR_29914_1 [Eumeta japonica]|uniref:Uncharacterized protein n=1 Tax=Eumeta variegata TaxID=151549 RepID=A0A4C1V874_EUMVA|nr:hypothetical protein EVAR_29914_1 [Eumeta japonica]